MGFADGTDWSYCSQESPDTWREEDLSISIECKAEYAILNYDLSKMASVNWLENVPVTIILYDKLLIKSSWAVTDFEETSAKVEGFCPGIDHKICIEFNKGGDPSNSFCKECSTDPRPPSSNPTGLTVSGMRDTLSLNWDTLLPECDDTMYEILINGEVAENVTETQKWLVRDQGTYEIAVRAINSEGPSKAKLVPVTHVLQDLVPPKDLEVSYKVDQQGMLIATITWLKSMVFSESDKTERGYYLNLYNKPITESSTIRTEAHDETLSINKTSFEVAFTDTMDWTIEYSLQTFYGQDPSEGMDSSDATDRAAVFSDQIVLSPPDACITKYEITENDTAFAHVKLWPTTDFVFNGLEVVASIWSENGSDILREIQVGAETDFKIELQRQNNKLFSLRTIAGGSRGGESEKQKLENNICFGYVEGWYILPFVVALVALLILIFLAIIYCICAGTCCRPIEEPKKDRSRKSSPETKILLGGTDANDNGHRGGGGVDDAKLKLLPSQTPTAFKQEPPTPDGKEKASTPVASSVGRRYLFSKSRDSIINLDQPGWIWRKNIDSDLF